MNKRIVKIFLSLIYVIFFFLSLIIGNDFYLKEISPSASTGCEDELIIKPLENNVKIIRPLEHEICTREEAITFLGMADPNKELKLNGKELAVYFTGNFVIEVPLKLGVNLLTFTQGDKTINYKVDREFKVIDSVTPSNLVSIEGGMKITITARLYSGSKAYAELNGKCIELREVPKNKYLSSRGTTYSNFIGNIITNEVKDKINLGHIIIHGNFNGVEETREGAEVIINKPEVKKTIGIINKDSALLYNSKTISVIPLNEVYPLAKGTEDYITSKIIADEKEYYNLASNKRVKSEDIDIVPFKELGSNEIKNIDIYEEDNNVFIKVNAKCKVPYTFLTDDIEFKDISNQDYTIENYRIGKIKIYFDYATNLKDKIDFKDNFLFRSANINNDSEKSYLELNLKDHNKYNGHFAYYDDEGYLTFRFKDKKRSIKDMTIVVDSGHGMIENNKLDPGALGFNCINENVINTEISKLIEKELKSKGASVIRLETENNSFPLKERGKQGRENDADLYISIHNNSGGSGKCNANETYYFTPYSKDVAKNINESLTKCYTNILFKGIKGDYSRGFKYNYYTVTLERENPSVLVEVGYIDNPVFFNKIINKQCQKKIANHIVKGIEKSVKE